MHDACRLSRCMMATAAGVREGGIDSAVSHPLARRISCGDYEFVSFILHVLHIYTLIGNRAGCWEWTIEKRTIYLSPVADVFKSALTSIVWTLFVIGPA